MPAVNQVRWAPSLFDAEVLEGHRQRGVVLEGYSPFKSTDLDDPVLVDDRGRDGVTTAQVVLRWHLDHGVVVIPKSVTPGADRGQRRRVRLRADRGGARPGGRPRGAGPVVRGRNGA